MIGFNKPYFTGQEVDYIRDAVSRKHISGNGYYTKKCQAFFEKRYGFKKCLLTTSCTDALEMAAILIETEPGDEIIMPSFTFASTANAFVLRGAIIRFVDSRPDHPGINEYKIEELINSRTKAIVVVHYAGVACDMDPVMKLAKKHGLYVVEDAAQSIDSYYKSKPLGGIGHFGCFSFHETKNINCGEGGMLVINDERYCDRAEIIWEKGTNRSAFFRGEVDKYGWVDIGSSFLPSDILAAILWAQIQHIEEIQQRRISIWNNYYDLLKKLSISGLTLPFLPRYSTNNGHMFYLVFSSEKQRSFAINELRKKNIMAVFHYQALESSYYFKTSTNRSIHENMNAKKYSERLLRLPFYYSLEEMNIHQIISELSNALSKWGITIGND